MNELGIENQIEVKAISNKEAVPSQKGDVIDSGEIAELKNIRETKGSRAVFDKEASGSTLEKQFDDLFARAEKTGRDVDLDLEDLKYRSKDGQMLPINVDSLNEEAVIAMKNYVLALEIAHLNPKTATIPELVKGLTGHDIHERDQILKYLRQVHPLIHDMYNLPSDELNVDGRRQEYVDQLVREIDKRNVDIEYGRTPSGSAACFIPNVNGKDSGVSIGKRQSINKRKGKIVLDPEKIDLTSGVEVIHPLAHEFVHVLQWDPLMDKVGRLTNLTVMEFDANVGPYVIDEKTDWAFVENLFNAIQTSLRTGECLIGQTANPAIVKNGPITLK